MATNDLPTIAHATVTVNVRGRYEVQMDDGWLFYRNDLYPEGTAAEDICYFRWGSFSPQTDIENILVVIDETTVNADQIFTVGNKPVTE